MVEFYVVYEKNSGAVVQKLASLVEKRGVVFVAFYHEWSGIFTQI